MEAGLGESRNALGVVGQEKTCTLTWGDVHVTTKRGVG